MNDLTLVRFVGKLSVDRIISGITGIYHSDLPQIIYLSVLLQSKPIIIVLHFTAVVPGQIYNLIGSRSINF